MRFGETLKHLRKEKDLTQAALAEQIGVSNVYISALERGDKPAPRLALVVSMARYLGVDEDKLWAIARLEREERLEARIQGHPTSLRTPRLNTPLGKTALAALHLDIQRLARRLEKAVISKQEEQALLAELEGLKDKVSDTSHPQ